MMAKSVGAVFISYSRIDSAVMWRIVMFLRQRRIKVWVDLENKSIPTGTPIWEDEIVKAIKSASAVIVVLSPDSKNSKWVLREISLAEENYKKIFPVLVSGNKDSSIPFRLINHQYADMREDEAAALKKLRISLSDHLRELPAQLIESQNDEKLGTREKAKATPSLREALENLRAKVSPRTFYSLIILGLVIAFALMGRYFTLQNREPGVTQIPSGTEEQSIATATVEETLTITNTVPTASPSATIAITETPSLTPSPSITPNSIFEAYVSATKAYLYKGPDLSFGLAVQIAYPGGEKFTVLRRNASGLWLLCKAADGNQGWLYLDWLNRDFKPTVTVIPTASFIPTLPPIPGRTPPRRPPTTVPICTIC